MFKVFYTKKENCYKLVATNGDEYYVKVSPCKGYPKTAKRPYKGNISLIKDSKFIPLPMPASLSLYSAIMDTVIQFINWQKDKK